MGTQKGSRIFSHCYRSALIIIVAFLFTQSLNAQIENVLRQFFIDNYQDPRRLKMAGNIYIPGVIKPELTVESAKKIIYSELDRNT
jgi:hypothetical protein